MNYKYKLISVDEKGYKLQNKDLGNGTFLRDEHYIEILITEEIAKFIENFCDVIYYPGRKVYVMNSQRYIMEPIINLEQNGQK